MVLEKQIPIHMLASSLPLNCLATSNKIKGRYRRIRLENALAFMPIYSGPASTHGHRWHSSRGLHPCRFDLFAGEGNKMTTVLGASRSGKSVLTNQLILEFLERFPEGIVRIIDKRTSYLKLADLLGGKIINFSEDALRKDPYSPFALSEWNEDDIENVFLLILTAIVQKNPGIRMTSIHTEILREAIKISYNNQAKNLQMVSAQTQNQTQIDPHPIWEDLLSNLPIASSNLSQGGAHGLDAAKDDLVLWSLSLTKSGQYGFIFSKHEHQPPTNDLKLLVYDLDGNSDPVLRQLSAMMAFIKISRDLAKLPRSAKKLIIFEELVFI
jgi:type IV secretory pathway VirB4 component